MVFYAKLAELSTKNPVYFNDQISTIITYNRKMCGKYILMVGNVDERMFSIINLCNLAADNGEKIRTDGSFEILPGDNAPALYLLNHKVEASGMQWGFSTASGLVINARSEDVCKRNMFKSLVDSQRCVLPAAGYFEWRDSDKQCYMISPTRKQFFYLAGLYRSDDRGNLHYVVLTRKAYGPHEKIHGRMPCLLYSRADARKYLSGVISIDSFASVSDELSIQAQGNEQIYMDFDD